MAKGLDDLLQYLVNQIALSGEKGSSPNDVFPYVAHFYNTQEHEANERSPTDQPSAGIDKAFNEQVWVWLVNHPDTFFVPGCEHARNWTLDQIEAHNAKLRSENVDLGESSLENDVKHQDPLIGQVRLRASEEQIWLALAGHGPDPKRLPALEFSCLSIIGSYREQGIVQPMLVRLTGQDKRSLPERTRRLVEKGYIIKRKVISNGSATSLCILRSFATQQLPPASQVRDYEGSWVQHRFSKFESVIREAIEVIEERGLITWIDVRALLDIPEQTLIGKRILEACRRFEYLGCLERVRTLHTAGFTSHAHTRGYRSFRSLRTVTDEDWESFYSLGREDPEWGIPADDQSILQTTKGESADAAFNEPYMLDGDEPVTGCDKLPLWNPDHHIANICFDAVSIGSTTGLITTDACELTTGPFCRRSTSVLLQTLSNTWYADRPMRLNIVRDAVQIGKKTLYKYFTFDQFQNAVEGNRAAWEAVGRPHLKESDLQQYAGFSNVPASEFFALGRSTLSECAKSFVNQSGKRQVSFHHEAVASADFPSLSMADDAQLPALKKAYVPREYHGSSGRKYAAQYTEEELSAMTAEKRKRIINSLETGRRYHVKRLRQSIDIQVEAGVDLEDAITSLQYQFEAAARRSNDSSMSVRMDILSELACEYRRSKYMPSKAAHTQLFLQPSQTTQTEVPLEMSNRKIERPYRTRKVVPSVIGYFPSSVAHSHHFHDQREIGRQTLKRNRRKADDQVRTLKIENNTAVPSKRRRANENATGTASSATTVSRAGRQRKRTARALGFDDLSHDNDTESVSAVTRQSKCTSKSLTYEQQYAMIHTESPGLHVGPVTRLKTSRRGLGPQSILLVFKTPKISEVLDHIVDRPDSTADSDRPAPFLGERPTVAPDQLPERQMRARSKRGAANSEDPPCKRRAVSSSKPVVSDNGDHMAERLLLLGEVNNLEPSEDIDSPVQMSTAQGDLPPGVIRDSGETANLHQHSTGEKPFQANQEIQASHLNASSRLSGVSSENMLGEDPSSMSLNPVIETRGNSSIAPHADGMSNERLFDAQQISVRESISPGTQHSSGSVANQPDKSATDSVLLSSLSKDQPHEQPSSVYDTKNLLKTHAVRHEQLSSPKSASATRNSTTMIGVDRYGGSVTANKQKIVMSIVTRCDGIFPGDREIWYPFAAEWMRMPGNSKPDTRTVATVVQQLVSAGKLKKIGFNFRSSNGSIKIKHILLLEDVSETSTKVMQLREKMIGSFPRLYIPDEAGVSEHFRRQPETWWSPGKPRSGWADKVIQAPIALLPMPKTVSETLQNSDAVSAVDRLRTWQEGLIFRKRLELDEDIENSNGFLPIRSLLAKVNEDFLPEESQIRFSETKRYQDRTQGGLAFTVPGYFPNVESKLRNPIVATRADFNSSLKILNSHSGLQELRSSSRKGTDIEQQRRLRQLAELRALDRNSLSGHDRSAVDYESLQKSLAGRYALLQPRPQTRLPRLPGTRTLHQTQPNLRISLEYRFNQRTEFKTAESQAVDYQSFDTEQVHFTNLGLFGTFREKPAWFVPQSLQDILNRGWVGKARTRITENQSIEAKFRSEVTRVAQWEQNDPSARMQVGRGYPFINFQPFSQKSVALNSNLRQTLQPRRRFVDRHFQREGTPKKRALGNNQQEQPRKRRRTTQIEKTDPSEDRDIVLAVLISRVLFQSGDERFTDWDVVYLLQAGSLDVEQLKKRWVLLRPTWKSWVAQTRVIFEREYLAAYEAGSVPELNYEELDNNDWTGLMTWAREMSGFSLETQISNVERSTGLPSSRQELLKQFILQDSKEPEKDVFEVRNKVTKVARRRGWVHQLALGIMEQDQAQDGHHLRLDDAVISRSWVKANFLTPSDRYRPSDAATKLSSATEFDLDKATQQLFESKLLMLRNKGRRLPGRAFDISEKFLVNFKANLEVQNYRQAVEYKEKLDNSLREGAQAAFDYYADEGSALALINMLAAGQVQIMPSNIKADKMGMLEGGYRARSMDKDALVFDLVIEPTEEYVTSNPLSSLPAKPRGNLYVNKLGIDKTPIPSWVDIHGGEIDAIWEYALNAVLSILTIRPGLSARGILDYVEPSLELWEIKAIFRWMVDAGIAQWKDEGDQAVRLGEWWWMAFAADSATSGRRE